MSASKVSCRPTFVTSMHQSALTVRLITTQHAGRARRGGHMHDLVSTAPLQCHQIRPLLLTTQRWVLQQTEAPTTGIHTLSIIAASSLWGLLDWYMSAPTALCVTRNVTHNVTHKATVWLCRSWQYSVLSPHTCALQQMLCLVAPVVKCLIGNAILTVTWFMLQSCTLYTLYALYDTSCKLPTACILTRVLPVPCLSPLCLLPDGPCRLYPPASTLQPAPTTTMTKQTTAAWAPTATQNAGALP
jgi:hypothetical protein